MVGWSVSATPVGGTDGDRVLLGAGDRAAALSRVTVPAPPEGRWVLLVHVRFDRDRGAFDGYGRLILAAADPAGSPAPPG